MWVESVEQIEGEAVGLCVERLDPAACDRTAAILAWMTLDALADGTGHPAAWHDFVDSLLRRHVTLAVAEERAAALSTEWWQSMVACALTHFLRENDLASHVNRHLQTMQWVAQRAHVDF